MSQFFRDVEMQTTASERKLLPENNHYIADYQDYISPPLLSINNLYFTEYGWLVGQCAAIIKGQYSSATLILDAVSLELHDFVYFEAQKALTIITENLISKNHSLSELHFTTKNSKFIELALLQLRTAIQANPRSLLTLTINDISMQRTWEPLVDLPAPSLPSGGCNIL